MHEAIQIVIGGLLQGGVFAMLALGFFLVYRVTGVINLAQGAFCVLAALSMHTLENSFGCPPLVAALLAVSITTLFGIAVGAWTFVPAIGRLTENNVLMLTVGLLVLTQGLALVIWGSEPYELPPFSGERPIRLLGLRVPSQGLWVAGTTVAVIVALWYLLARTSLGRALRACADNALAAQLMGISVPRMTLLSFGMTTLIAAIGGVVMAPLISLQFDVGQMFTISGFIAATIGGIESFAGAIFGGIALGVIEQLAAGYVSSMFANGLALGLLMITLLWRPKGLFAPRLTRRQDVRETRRVYGGIVRLAGPRAWAVGALAIAVALALPWLVPSGLLSSLVITGILFIALLGLDVLMGYTGQVSLGHSGFMAIGGYTAAILSTTYGWPPLLGTGAGMLLSVIVALALALVSIRLRGLYLALATLAFALLVDSLTVGLTDITGGPSGLTGIPSFSIGSYVFSTPLSMYYLVVTLAVVLVLLLAGGMSSAFGRALQAVRSDQMAAAALSINVTGYKIAAFVISALLASLAGSLYAFFFHYLSPEMVGTQRSLDMVAMLVIGGEGTLVGCLLGTMLLTLLPTIFQPLAMYKTFAEGLLLVLFFLYLPQGLFGVIAKQIDRIRFRRSEPREVRAVLVGEQEG
jgi:ABC-type branched-subunit amino acid transport system permease subunit